MIYRILLLLTIIVSSCIKIPKDSYVSELKVPFEFDWKTIETQTVKIVEVSNVVNDKGDTIATLLPPGDYNLTVVKNSTLSIVKSNTAPATKAIGGSVKDAVYFPSKGNY